MRRLGRSRIAIVLLLALTSGASLFAFAGARRTQSSYPRYLRAVHGSDMAVSSPGGYDAAATRWIASLPEVRTSRTYVSFEAYAIEDGRPEVQRFEAIGTFDGEYYDQDRFTPTSGRVPHRDDPDEVAVNALLAADLGYRLGQRIDLGVYTVAPDPGAEDEAEPVMRRTVTVVGIGLFPDEILQDEADRTNRLLLTPAFSRIARPQVTYGLQGLVLQRGDADLPALRRHLAQRFPEGLNAIRETRVDRFHAIQATRPVSVALAIFGAISAIAAVLLTSQALLGLGRSDRPDQEVLRAIGGSPRFIMRRALASPALVVLIGVVAGSALAVLASPLMPAGPIRKVIDPSVDVDLAVIGLGAAAFALVIFAVVAAGTFRGLPHRRAARGSGTASRSRLIGRLADALPPSPAAGLRMAFGRSSATASVPALVVVAGATVAAAALTAAVTFGGSLNHLVDTPHLYGWNWDAALLPGNGYDNTPLAEANRTLRGVDDVEEWSGGFFGIDDLDGRATPMLGMSVGSKVHPPLVEGRAIRQPAEIVLGAATAAALGKEIGDTVEVVGNDTRRVVTVVGIATMPTIGQIHVAHTSLGVGAIVTPDLVSGSTRDILGEVRPGLGPNVIFVRYRSGVDPGAALARLDRAVRPLAGFAGIVTLPIQRPAEIASAESPRALPMLLAGALGAAALLSLLLAVASSSRRHRRDLALCRTLGFTSRQVTGSLVWQASIIVLAALVVGVPVGAALGASLWRRFADQLDVVAAVELPFRSIVLMTVIALVAANLAAVIPGRAAARTSPARVLRQA